MLLLEPLYWKDYELIDSGNFEKLERFGKYILLRPEPQAVWNKHISASEWTNMAHASFIKNKQNQTSDNEKGEWKLKPQMPQQWFINYAYKEMNLKFRLGLTAFKHIGIFPEQAENWNYIFDSIKKLNISKPRVLNLFAYTGGASLAAKCAGAEVTHVDSVKQVIVWANQNMEASRLNNIRWIVEDAVKFVNREVKRGNIYDGIILDPPAYGRGPKGEKWILEDNINELLQQCKKILNPNKNLLVLNLYSMGFSALIAESLIKSIFNNQTNLEIGELYINDRISRKLPLGIFARFINN
jgi:23S rRNA (cytosine1962-C5)-methyltransferase